MLYHIEYSENNMWRKTRVFWFEQKACAYTERPHRLIKQHARVRDCFVKGG